MKTSLGPVQKAILVTAAALVPHPIWQRLVCHRLFNQWLGLFVKPGDANGFDWILSGVLGIITSFTIPFCYTSSCAYHGCCLKMTYERLKQEGIGKRQRRLRCLRLR